MSMIPSQKTVTIAWGVLTAIYVTWYAFIYGVMGHVCPFAFIALWVDVWLAAFVFTHRRPHWAGTFLSLLFVAGAFIWAWSEHDPEPYLHVTPEPVFIFILGGVIAFLVNVVVARKVKVPVPRDWQKRLSKAFGLFVACIGCFVGVAYIGIPAVKEDWTHIGSQGLEWYDTFWQGYDEYYILLFLALFLLVSSVAWIAGVLIKRKKPDSPWIKGLQVIGLGFWGLALIGILPLYWLIEDTPQSGLNPS